MARNEASVRAVIEQLTAKGDTSGMIGMLEAQLRNASPVGYWEGGTYVEAAPDAAPAAD